MKAAIDQLSNADDCNPQAIRELRPFRPTAKNRKKPHKTAANGTNNGTSFHADVRRDARAATPYRNFGIVRTCAASGARISDGDQRRRFFSSRPTRRGARTTPERDHNGTRRNQTFGYTEWVTWGELLRRLKAAGFVDARTGKGSHRQLVHRTTGQVITIAVHTKKESAPDSPRRS